jgi:hypothetical protein
VTALSALRAQGYSAIAKLVAAYLKRSQNLSAASSSGEGFSNRPSSLRFFASDETADRFCDVALLRSEGIILWYDYHVNNSWNKDVRGVNRREITQLFPDCRIELKRTTLLPPLARFLAPYSYLGCYLLAKVPLLCTHYLGVIRKG